MLGSGAPRFGPEGDFAGYVGNCTDITDLKRSQEENLARQKLESVGRLASGIAHDFNNLLGGVLAQADLALEELASGARPEEELNRIRMVAIARRRNRPPAHDLCRAGECGLRAGRCFVA